jgi:hypothetical protein
MTLKRAALHAALAANAAEQDVDEARVALADSDEPRSYIFVDDDGREETVLATPETVHAAAEHWARQTDGAACVNVVISGEDGTADAIAVEIPPERAHEETEARPWRTGASLGA